MNKDTIDRLHKLESERYGLQERIESLKKVFAEKPRDLIVEIKAMGWHSGHDVMRFNEMPQEIMDALKKVSERMAKELDEVIRQIEEL